MTNVFISYSRKDKPFAGRFVEALEKSKLETWIDWEDIPPTADWMDQIHKGIEDADAFLFLLSPDSVASRVCGQEVDHAVQNGKRLIPIVARDVNPNDVHSALARVNWIYCRENDDFDGAVNKILSAIRTNLAWVESHRRLQVRAIEWEGKNKENSFLLRGKDLQDAEQQLSLHATTDPPSTDLQREYVLKSRQVADKQRRLLTALSIAAAVIMSGLAIFGFNRAMEATNQRNMAQNNAATAVANANIALSRQLSAQAKAISLNGNADQTTAVLLAIQSMKIYPTTESAQFLQQTPLRLPIISLKQSAPVVSVAYSPDGNYIAVGEEDGTVRVWETSTWQEINRFAHENSVRHISFNPDGLHLVTGSDDRTVRVWGIRSGKEVTRVTHNGEVTLLVISPDGQYTLSSEGCAQGDSDGFFCEIGGARLWKTVTGEEVLQAAYPNFISAAAFSPDGKHFALGGGDGVVHVWEIASGQETAQLASGLWVSSIAFSPANNRIAAGGCEKSPAGSCTQGSIRVWFSWSGDFVEAMEELQLTQHYSIDSISFSPDGARLVSKSEEGLARIWDSEFGEELFGISPKDGMGMIAYSIDGYSLISFGTDAIRAWDAENGQETARMLVDFNSINSIALSPDGNYLVSGGKDGAVQVWPSAQSPFIGRMTNEIESLAINDMGDPLAGASDAYEMKVWDVTSNRAVMHVISESQIGQTVFSPHLDFVVLIEYFENVMQIWERASGKEVARIRTDAPFNNIAFAANGKYVTASVEGNTHFWELSTGTEIHNPASTGFLQDITFNHDDAYRVSLECDEKGNDNCLAYGIWIWDRTTGRQIAHINQSGRPMVFSLSTDGKYLASGGCDDVEKDYYGCLGSAGTLSIWEVNSGRNIVQIHHDVGIEKIAFSPDGKYIASASGVTAYVRDVPGGREIARMTHDAGVTSIAFSPDGEFVVSGGDDYTVRVWKAITGREIARMTHSSHITAVAFDQNGKYIASGSGDGIVRVWMWRPEDVIADACERIARNLTREEWRLYMGEFQPYQATCPDLPIESEAAMTPTP